MNLDNLKNIKIDFEAIKNFSIEDVRDFVNEQQVLVLNVIIALATLIAVIVILNTRVQEYALLQSQLNVFSAKEDPVRKYEKSLKKGQELLRTSPLPLTEDKMIPYITEVAARRHVLIDSFEVPRTEAKGFYRETRITLACQAPDFHEAMLFVQDLERSAYWLKVDSLSLTAQREAGDGSDPDARPRAAMSMLIAISSIELMENAHKNPKKQ